MRIIKGFIEQINIITVLNTSKSTPSLNIKQRNNC